MFHHRHKLFWGDVGHCLNDARRPLNSHEVNVGGIPETEIRPQFVVACPATAARDLAQLPAAHPTGAGFDAHLGPDGGTVRDSPDQFDREPSVAVAVIAVEVIAATVASGCEQVQEAVVVIVSPSTTPGITVFVDRAAGGNLGKGPIAIVVI